MLYPGAACAGGPVAGRCLSKPRTLLINYYTPGMLITGAASAFKRAPGRKKKDIQFLITRTPGVARSRLENDDANRNKKFAGEANRAITHCISRVV